EVGGRVRDRALDVALDHQVLVGRQLAPEGQRLADHRHLRLLGRRVVLDGRLLLCAGRRVAGRPVGAGGQTIGCLVPVGIAFHSVCPFRHLPPEATFCRTSTWVESAFRSRPEPLAASATSMSILPLKRAPSTRLTRGAKMLPVTFADSRTVTEPPPNTSP